MSGMMAGVPASPELLAKVDALPPATDVPGVDVGWARAAAPRFTLRQVLRPFALGLIIGLVLDALDALASLAMPALVRGGITYQLDATYYAVAGAKQNLEKAQQDLRSVRDAAVVDLESNWASYANSYDQVKVQHALLDAARQRNDEADVRYASGLMTYDNWEIIASDRISSELRAVERCRRETTQHIGK